MTTPLNQRRNANAIRALAMDAVQQANSGHPGAPMGMADIADVVWREFLSHNPTNPQWANGDFNSSASYTQKHQVIQSMVMRQGLKRQQVL